MKTTFLEEVEYKRAWAPKMHCRNCGYNRYQIHHQFDPEEDEGWWCKCSGCGRLSAEMPTRDLAILAWRGVR